jgi:hypothetical protein
MLFPPQGEAVCINHRKMLQTSEGLVTTCHEVALEGFNPLSQL